MKLLRFLPGEDPPTAYVELAPGDVLTDRRRESYRARAKAWGCVWIEVYREDDPRHCVERMEV